MLDIVSDKKHCAVQHLRKSALYAAVVNKTLSGFTGFAEFCSGYRYGCYDELGEIRLRIDAEQQNGCQSRNAIACNAHQFFYALLLHA